LRGALRELAGAAGDDASVGDGGRVISGRAAVGYDRLLRGTLAGGVVDDVWRSHTADPVVGFRLIMLDARSLRWVEDSNRQSAS
jgi:hypothetical protein